MTDHTHQTEHKAPAKKRASRKKVAHTRTHRELEWDAFSRKLGEALKQPVINHGQVQALAKKIVKYAPKGI